MFYKGVKILTNGGGKKSPKLHKYTLRLYNYAILQGLISGAG